MKKATTEKSAQGFYDLSGSATNSSMEDVASDGYHAEPFASGSERSMTTDSQAAENSNPDPEVEFTTVSHRRRHFAMLPVRALPNGRTPLSDMVLMVRNNLRKIATVIGHPEIEYLPAADATAIEAHIVFEVGSAEQLENTARAGFFVHQETGEPIKMYYQKYTQTLQQEQESRRVSLVSMAWTTKADDVHAAMSLWGTVASVRMGFNPQKSMATATVLFAKADAVEEMTSANTTFVLVGHDVAAVKQLGTKVIPVNSLLTMKLTQLPPYYMPIDVVHLLESVPAQNAERSFQAVTMPVHPHTKRRLPEAFVYFANNAQWERVRSRVFNVGIYSTAWVSPNTLTCRVCASAKHLQKECPVHQRRLNLRRTRQNNTLAMHTPAPAKRIIKSTPNPSAQSNAAASTQHTTASKSSAPRQPAPITGNNKATTPGTKQTYSGAVTNKGKAVVRSPPVKAPIANAASAAPTTSKPSETATDDSYSGRLGQQVKEIVRQMEEDKKKWAAFSANYAHLITRVDSMESKLDRILDALNGKKEGTMEDIMEDTVEDTMDTDSPSSETTTVSNVNKAKRGSESDGAPAPVETTELAMSPNKMDTVAQLQLQLNAMKEEQVRASQETEKIIQAMNMYKEHSEKLQAILTSLNISPEVPSTQDDNHDDNEL